MPHRLQAARQEEPAAAQRGSGPGAQTRVEFGVQGRLVPANQSSVDTTPSVYATNYDPRSGEYTGPDGKVYRVDTASSKGEVATQWEQLITSTLK